jgi:hypothetical protein
VAKAEAIMDRFAERTGLLGGVPRRYLWTDAFAVCNLLGLMQVTGDGRHRETALRLVDQVHHTLGQYRPDDTRRGWISGLPADGGEAHPTCGGLRIGKPNPERRADEPFDERREWDRDGQYFHYATKWMHALDQVARTQRQACFNLWARELARAVYRGFTYTAGDHARRMYWKVSTDLSRPLVLAMGQHDPLDGFITTVQLDATAAALATEESPLTELTAGFAAMVDTASLATSDPLGLGGLLVDAYRVVQLDGQAALGRDPQLLGALLDAVAMGLPAWRARTDLNASAEARLAFRELGLAIGLGALELLARARRGAPRPDPALDSRLAALAPYASLRTRLEDFWLDPAHQRSASWQAHQDINDVMLATALLPDGFASLQGLRS